MCLAIQSDIIAINGNFYRHTRGLPMGNNLSPILAIMYMNFIEQDILHDNRIVFWRRYIDDVFCVSVSPLDELLPQINSLSHDIQFTLENSNTGALPFLDTSVRLEQVADRGQKFSTALFIKPQHSGHILPWCSFAPMSRKVALLKSERIRALRICNGNAERAAEALNVLKDRFLQNGYPLDLIGKVLLGDNTAGSRNTRRSRNRSGVVQSTSGDNNNDNNTIRILVPYLGEAAASRVRSGVVQPTSGDNNDDNNTIRILAPYLGEAAASRVRHVVRNCNISHKIVPVFVTPAPLGACVRSDAPLECGDRCICHGQNLCMRKNVVYRISCSVCTSFYIGETFRTVLSRCREHFSNKDGPVYAHAVGHHGMYPSRDMFSITILGGGFRNTLHRTAREQQLIESLQPDLNIQHASSRNSF